MISKCKYYNNGWCELPECKDDVKYKPCGDMTLFDCHYKQLQKANKKLEKIEERIQDLDNYSENNVNVMNDILQIIQEKSENEKV